MLSGSNYDIYSTLATPTVEFWNAAAEMLRLCART